MVGWHFGRLAAGFIGQSETEGCSDGCPLGMLDKEGFAEGRPLGRDDGCDVGQSELEGFIEGWLLGAALIDGNSAGIAEG